ncbi:MAG: Hsp20/alpha crystallin family protein [Planctomycetota bacterium]|nr:Hsp20/alpha crystallin family protein [Planctomycetota bacterium]
MNTEDQRASRGNNGHGVGGIEAILSGLGNLLGTLGELAEKGEALKREGSGQTASGKHVSFHYGVSVRTAQGGREIKVEPFGNVNPAASVAETSVHEVREPLTDVFEEADHVLVVVEMPGLGAADARFELTSDVLTISGARGSKRYHKEVLLPVDGLTLDASAVRCNNGVFEVHLSR